MQDLHYLYEMHYLEYRYLYYSIMVNFYSTTLLRQVKILSIVGVSDEEIGLQPKNMIEGVEENKKEFRNADVSSREVE